MKIVKLLLCLFVLFLFSCNIPIGNIDANASIHRLNVPSGIRASVQSVSKISLSWNPVSNAKSYAIFRAEGDGNEYTKLAVVGVTIYSDETVSANKDYTYKISAAMDESGNGPQSDAFNVATKVPATVSGLNTMPVSGTQIVVSWQTVTGATGYNVFRATTAEGVYEKRTAATISELSYSDSVSINTDYHYKVKAENGIGESAFCDPVLGSTKLPASPSGLAVVSGGGIGTLTISWNAVSGVEKYRLYRKTGAAGSFAALTDLTDTVYTDTGLSVETEYFYQVSSLNVIGEGDRCAAASFVAPAIPAPVGLKAVVKSATSIEVSWNAVEGASGYKLYASESGSSYYTLATPAAATYTHTGLSTGATYYYKVSALAGDSVESVQSAVVSATIAVPAAPANLTVTPLSSSSLQISWDPVPGAVMYSVYQRADGGTPSSSNIISSTSSTTFTNTGLYPFRRYDYKVSATNEIGTGPLTTTAVYNYTQPIPLTEGEWYVESKYDYSYYSFPVSAGTYYIKWGNAEHTGETYEYNRVSAYWSSTNQMNNLTTTLFLNQNNGFANPREISVSDGFVIVKGNPIYFHYADGFSLRVYR
ncbi:hypothetical protein FACS189494_07670 [Spirochaetia bacterium]|nr:hypothetical protein FACS189494_07670 [Spirochaetia bacterium]